MDPRLEFAILLLQQVLGIILSEQEQSPRLAKEGTPYNIEALAQDTHIALLDQNFGLDALRDAIGRIRSDGSGDPRPDLDTIFETLLALTPVTLPEIPPPGYGPGDVVSVWGEVFGTYAWCALD